MSRRESGEETAAGDGPRQPTASEEASGGSAAVSSLLVSNGTDPSLPSQSQTSAASAAEHADSFATLLTTPLLSANVLRPDTDTLDARIADTERQLQQARKLAELNRELAALSVSPKAATGARPGAMPGPPSLVAHPRPRSRQIRCSTPSCTSPWPTATARNSGTSSLTRLGSPSSRFKP